MNRFAFSRGQGLAYADLPPTLQPFAIASAAPHDNHLRAAGYSGLIYVLVASALFAFSALSPRAPIGIVPKTDPGRVVVFEPRDSPRIELPSVTPPGGGSQVDSGAIVRALTPVGVPDTAASDLSREDHSRDVVNPGNSTSLRPDAPQVDTGVRPGTGPIVHDFSMTGLQVLQRVDPIYPEMARRAHVQGTVVLLMTVDEAGVPTQVQVLDGHPALQDAASRAARQWRFVPAQLDGRAVAASFRLTLKFSMK
ncbi:MAG TPA: energy transducer TonB [Geothrix sp.]|nr:energy transducer TonB [Geothrix sp.]